MGILWSWQKKGYREGPYSTIPFIRLWAQIRRAYSLKKHLLYSIVLLRSLTSRATSKLAARSRNDKMQRGLVTTTNDPSTINQQPLVTQYRSVVDGMINSCSQCLAQLPTILTYMSLTVMHRTCNILHESTEFHLFQSNYPISWYPPSSKRYSRLPKHN